jgi:hypothetical protein
MPRNRGIQLAGLQNMDRLIIKSMLTLIAPHLDVRWHDAGAEAVVTLADADTTEGFKVLDQAKRAGGHTIGLSSRPLGPWMHLLARPPQTKDLLTILEKIDRHELAREAMRALAHASGPAPLKAPGSGLSSEESVLLRKAGNFFDYLCRARKAGIVEVRFAPGRSVMCNHDTGEFVSAMSLNVLSGMALNTVQETAHGVGQAQHEWKIATRILPVGALEDLTWRVVSVHSGGIALPRMPSACKLARLPRLSEALSVEQMAIAKFLARCASDINATVRATGVSREKVVNFFNAALACDLVGATPNGYVAAPTQTERANPGLANEGRATQFAGAFKN